MAYIPFLVDSVRMELNRHGYSIHTLQNSVFSVRRDKNGQAAGVLPRGHPGRGRAARSVDVFGNRPLLQCGRAENPGEIHSRSLRRRAYERCRLPADEGQGRELLAWLDRAKLEGGQTELDEIKVYLNWLLDNHFTFLGYEEFALVDPNADGGHLVYDERLAARSVPSACAPG